jgi:hypothetical protein
MDKHEKKMLEARLEREKKMIEEFGRPAKPGYHLTRNILSDRVIEVKDGTPNYLDPSCEAYHCM